VNFYELIGPTIFHLFIPLYKFHSNKGINYLISFKFCKKDLIEFENIFNTTKEMHPFEMLKYLKDTKNQYYDETIKDNYDSMDPNLYMEKAIDNYKNYEILS
jgi:hypothetical protein